MDIDHIQQRIFQAKNLHIMAKNTSTTAEILDMSAYAGVIDYHPEELVITVKAGTKITDIQRLLADNGQTIPFALQHRDNSTIGGAYATGSPELRDAILGVKIIDGKGQLLNFGGQVMKNVAGYDVARLLVGSKGSLAVICEISFRVLPQSYAITSPSSETVKSYSQSSIRQQIERGLKNVFDPMGIFI